MIQGFFPWRHSTTLWSCVLVMGRVSIMIDAGWQVRECRAHESRWSTLTLARLPCGLRSGHQVDAGCRWRRSFQHSSSSRGLDAGATSTASGCSACVIGRAQKRSCQFDSEKRNAGRFRDQRKKIRRYAIFGQLSSLPLNFWAIFV